MRSRWIIAVHWVATEKHGVAMFDGSAWHTYTVANTKNLRTNRDLWAHYRPAG